MHINLTFAARNREVPEWLKGLAWKAGIRETVSRVRIPSSLQKKLMISVKGAFFVLKHGKLFSLANKIKKDSA